MQPAISADCEHGPATAAAAAHTGGNKSTSLIEAVKGCGPAIQLVFSSTIK